MTPSPLHWTRGLGKHPCAGFGTAMEDIKRTSYTKNQPIILASQWEDRIVSVFLHYEINHSKGVFWPTIPLNLTSEGLKYPPEDEFNIKHVVLYVGHLYKPFWTKKIWLGRQEGPGKVKIWHIWVISMGHVHQCIILTFPDPPCQPGQIFDPKWLVQVSHI